MTLDGKINNIDKLINLFDKESEISEKQIEDALGTETLGVIRTVQSLNIVLQKSDGKYVTGVTYYEIMRHGSFKLYHEYEKEKLLLNKGLLQSSLQTNTSLINSNTSLIETNRSIRKSNFIMPIILSVTFIATCGQIAVTWYTSETRTYKLKTEQLEQTLQQRDTQLKKLENEIKNLQLKLDSVSQ